MGFLIEAACACHTGRIRRNNEDNFFFDGRCLEVENQGLRNPACLDDKVKNGLCYGVFDGMGGENFGEQASYAAARGMQQMQRRYADFFVSERKYLEKLASQLNAHVVMAGRELCTDKMGATMAVLYYTSRYVYSCNVGDSRAYRLRDGVFQQLSRDHVVEYPGMEDKKAPLSQYLGIDPEEMQLEPYIAKGELKRGDRYLLCSDGLTDMLTNFEIADILMRCQDMEVCARELIDAAIAHGGRDNITVIVSKII